MKETRTPLSAVATAFRLSFGGCRTVLRRDAEGRSSRCGGSLAGLCGDHQAFFSGLSVEDRDALWLREIRGHMADGHLYVDFSGVPLSDEDARVYLREGIDLASIPVEDDDSDTL